MDMCQDFRKWQRKQVELPTIFTVFTIHSLLAVRHKTVNTFFTSVNQTISNSWHTDMKLNLDMWLMNHQSRTKYIKIMLLKKLSNIFWLKRLYFLWNHCFWAIQFTVIFLFITHHLFSKTIFVYWLVELGLFSHWNTALENNLLIQILILYSCILF